MVNAKLIDGDRTAALTFGKLRNAAACMTASIRDTAPAGMALPGETIFGALSVKRVSILCASTATS
jgi:hypothetical protein